MSGRAKGRLVGVGTGPGDPELLTVKAVRALAEADVVAHFAKQGNNGNARAIVDGMLKPGVTELPLLYPVTTELDRHDPEYRERDPRLLRAVGRRRSRRIWRRGGRSPSSARATRSSMAPTCICTCGSRRHFDAEVIPGVTAMSGCWSEVGVPIVQGDDVLTVLPGTLSEFELTRRLADTDAAVVMKVGRNLPKIRRALAATGKLAGAVYVERGTMPGGSAMRLADKPDDRAPYFALILVAGWRERP